MKNIHNNNNNVTELNPCCRIFLEECKGSPTIEVTGQTYALHMSLAYIATLDRGAVSALCCCSALYIYWNTG
jgi:hypothetical protein